ncbi:MAG TPA: aspartate dehydrogenase [Blastocatellia bacterium]|nr:aspartate dehydrogenase [Blastocatellia bacterium]
MRIGLIGFGTIGRAVARAIAEGRAGNAEMAAILVRDVAKAREDDVAGPGVLITADPDQFFGSDLYLVVEACGHAGLKQYGERALRGGCDVLAVSVGAFADDDFYSSIRRAAEESRRRLLAPSGALGALDAISAAAIGELQEVVLVARKPPAAWKGTPAEEVASKAATEPVCFYEGRAREAAKLFPQNVNVVAALSLAGVGFDRTIIRMYADPTVKHNTFELHASGEFGEVRLELKNRPYPENPKTGRLVVMSVIKSIRRLQENVIIGW